MARDTAILAPGVLVRAIYQMFSNKRCGCQDECVWTTSANDRCNGIAGSATIFCRPPAAMFRHVHVEILPARLDRNRGSSLDVCAYQN